MNPENQAHRSPQETLRRKQAIIDSDPELKVAFAALVDREEKYRTLFQSVNSGFCIIEMIFDQQGRAQDYRFTEVNELLEQLTGFSDALGKTIRELSPEIEPFWIETYGAIATTGRSARFTQHSAALGRWYAVQAFRIGPPEKAQVAVLFDDITAREQAAQDARHKEVLGAYLLRLADGLRRIADPLEIERHASRVLREHLGADRVYYLHFHEERGEAVIHVDCHRDHVESIAGTYSLADYASIHEALRRTGELVIEDILTATELGEAERRRILGRGTRSCAAVGLSKDGVLVAAVFATYTDAHEWTARETEAIRETAERTWSAVERAKALSDLHEANRRKDKFLAVLAHELRNPLAPIRSGLDIMRLRAKLDERLQQTVGMMNRQLTHLVRLVDDLLDISRLNTGKLRMQFEPVCIQDVITTSLEAAQAGLQEHRLESELPARSLFVNGDFHRLAQILSNIISNAAKFTPQGGLIRLRAVQLDSEVVVHVTDTGVGIDRKDLALVFDLFSQVGQHEQHPHGGLGIGLALVKQLVEMHEGTVTAESEGLGTGATFSVRLPLLVSARDAASGGEHCASSMAR